MSGGDGSGASFVTSVGWRESFPDVYAKVVKGIPLQRVGDTHHDIGATVAFLVLCQYDSTVIRWRLMLPLAAAGGTLLLWRRRRAPVWEARLCTLLLGLLLALVVLRDIGLSRKLAELYDKVEGYKTQVHQATSEISRFFNGGR